MGSSPRGRGKRRSGHQCLRSCRLIPAWAGKTSGRAGGLAVRRAHPRVGGENVVLRRLSAVAAGSSPRGRGKHEAWAFDADSGRLIPAWAGKTLMVSAAGSVIPAHPRVGGENRLLVRVRRRPDGSSPRGRGKPCRAGRLRSGRRLIPAWAGKTVLHDVLRDRHPAHPRVGGENHVFNAHDMQDGGSSPRGRGKRLTRVSVSVIVGLIPAWAGKTLCPAWQRRCCRAHPRVGGENPNAWQTHLSLSGSSPRGRGKRH